MVKLVLIIISTVVIVITIRNMIDNELMLLLVCYATNRADVNINQ